MVTVHRKGPNPQEEAVHIPAQQGITSGGLPAALPQPTGRQGFFQVKKIIAVVHDAYVRDRTWLQDDGKPMGNRSMNPPQSQTEGQFHNVDRSLNLEWMG